MAIGGEAARLFVTVGADIDEYLAKMRRVDSDLKSSAKGTEIKVGADTSAATRSVGKLATEVRSLSARPPTIKPRIDMSGVTRPLGELKATLTSNQGLLAGVVGGITGGLSYAAIGGAVQGINAIVSGMVNGAAEMERYETQFSVLLGTMDAAKARMADLAEFAKVTPFELPEVVQASRTLQVFTKGILATGEGLRLVGDVAAGTGSNFQETAMWFGRLYDAMQSGRPFGEATMRLQEMGAISGESRAKIEALADRVKSGAVSMQDAWKTASGEFSRYSGMMQKQSTTLEGKWSNLSDSINALLRDTGEMFLPAIKGVVDSVISGLDDIRAKATGLDEQIKGIAVSLGANKDQTEGLSLSLAGLAGNIGLVVAALAKFPAAAPVAAAPLAQQAYEALFGTISSFIGGPTYAEFQRFMAGSATGPKLGAPAPAGAGTFGAGVQQAQAVLNKAYLDMADRAEAGTRAAVQRIGSTLAAGKDTVGAGATTMASGIDDAVEWAKEQAALAAARTPGAIAEGLRSKRAEWMGALEQLRTDMSSSMTKTAEIAAVKAALLSAKLAEGLKSGDPVVKLQAQQTTKILLDRLVELEGKARAYGEATGNEYAQGIIDARGAAAAASMRLASAAGKFLEAGSPPKEGPLASIAKWGENTALAWVLGWDKGSAGIASHVSSSLERARVAAEKEMERWKTSFDNFGTWMQSFPARSFAGIEASLEGYLAKLSKVWAKLDLSAQLSAISTAGGLVAERNAAAGMPDAAKPYAVAIDKLQAYIANLIEQASKVTGPAREKILAKAAEYYARIEDYKAKIDEIVSGVKDTTDQAVSYAANAINEAGDVIDQFGNTIAGSTMEWANQYVAAMTKTTDALTQAQQQAVGVIASLMSGSYGQGVSSRGYGRKSDEEALADYTRDLLASGQYFYDPTPSGGWRVTPVGQPSLSAIGLAGGGTAYAGQPYVVGEKRPELFVPGRTGAVLPDLGALGGVTINLSSQVFSGTKSEARAFAQQIYDVLVEESRRRGVTALG